MKEDKEEIPLKTILQNFLNHVETLEAARDEGEDQYEKEFQVDQLINLINEIALNFNCFTKGLERIQ